MGGFEGGDEGGFWDVDSVPNWIDKMNSKSKHKEKPSIELNGSIYSIKAYAIGDKNIYDTISFVPCSCETFTIEGCDEISLESNTIYKAYKVLNDLDVIEFFCEHKVVLEKRIPLNKGLGGASSDAAAFLSLIKEVCNLILSTGELLEIGRTL